MTRLTAESKGFERAGSAIVFQSDGLAAEEDLGN
jgi:hypothetical protein